jgi:hypothetical protein
MIDVKESELAFQSASMTAGEHRSTAPRLAGLDALDVEFLSAEF